MTNPDYQRGYNRGKASEVPMLARYRKAVEEANERARRAEAGVCGPCQNCARWSRNDNCHWGYCEFPKVIGIEDDNWWGEPDHKVCTQENFGCVRFLKQSRLMTPAECAAMEKATQELDAEIKAELAQRS